MANGHGNLLLTAEGLETIHIPEKDRENTVIEFYIMKSEAERNKDCFFVLESVYSHEFSYGSFYPNLYCMTWAEFKACHSLKGIGQRVYELMHAFCQNPNILSLADENAFFEKDEPRAYTGYSNPKSFPVFVGDRTAWEAWHRDWFSTHPSDIDWRCATNEWLPRQDIIMAILKRELLTKFREEGYNESDAKRMLGQIANKDIVNVFHKRVMGQKGDMIEGYASKIGGEICLCNYYTYEAELSSLEHQRANSLRKIYSIVNKNGKLQFISIDFRHGMFEFLDENGEHQGEYHFDGSYNSPSSPDHSFKCMKQWLKQKRK